MKKIITILSLITLVAASNTALGFASINFSSQNFAYLSDGITKAPNGGWTVELIWAGYDSSINPFSGSNPLSVTGDDVVLRTFTPNNTAGFLLGSDYPAATPTATASSTQTYLETAYGVTDHAFVGTKMYYRLFDGTTSISHYYESGLSGVVPAEASPASTLTFRIGTAGAGVAMTTAVVPEPSSIALMGIGLVIFAVVRRGKRSVS